MVNSLVDVSSPENFSHLLTISIGKMDGHTVTQETYSQVDRPSGLYVRIYGGTEITSVEDLDVWVRELNDPIREFAIKITGAMDNWYVTCPALLNHPDIPLMLEGSGLEQTNAHTKIQSDASQFISKMNVRMAMEHATLPIYADGLLILSPDGSTFTLKTYHFPPKSHRNNRYEIVSSTEFKGFEPKKRVELLLSKFFLTLCHRNDAERYSAIYQVIEVAERLVGEVAGPLVGKENLAKKLGDDRFDYKDLRTLANDYRHAVSKSADRKGQGRSYDEAALLKKIVRMALELYRDSPR
ncbi:MAG: hypothetical protein WDN49_18320 [Acetobacteraceae bacterium]